MRILLSNIFLLNYLLMFANSEGQQCSKYDFEEKVLEKMVRMEFQMERIKTEMEQTVKNVEVIDTKLQTLKDQIVTPTVAFKARLDDHTAAPEGKVIVFPVVLFNKGDAYSIWTGKFTATTDGTYLFTVALCLYSNNYVHVDIMVDGVSYSKTYIRDKDYVDCDTADTVTVLKAGQSVWVQPSASTSGYIIRHDSLFYWNTFSGVLLHK